MNGLRFTVCRLQFAVLGTTRQAQCLHSKATAQTHTTYGTYTTNMTERSSESSTAKM